MLQVESIKILICNISFYGFLVVVFGMGMAYEGSRAGSEWQELIKKDYIKKEEVIEILNDSSGAKTVSALKLCLLEREVNNK